jgi:hypothetical protein
MIQIYRVTIKSLDVNRVNINYKKVRACYCIFTKLQLQVFHRNMRTIRAEHILEYWAFKSVPLFLKAHSV